MKSSKLILFIITLFVSGLAFQSCNSNRTDNDGRDTTANVSDNKEAEKRNDAKFNKDAEDNAQFVVDAADINLMEMNAGQLAESRATNKDVKALATMMYNDHKKAYDELASLAAKKNITIPASLSEKGKKDYDNLNEKNGHDFDKQFCDMMVDGHKDAIDKFDKASKNVTDSDIQAWAANMLPALRGHLDHAMTCQEKVDKIK